MSSSDEMNTNIVRHSITSDSDQIIQNNESIKEDQMKPDHSKYMLCTIRSQATLRRVFTRMDSN